MRARFFILLLLLIPTCTLAQNYTTVTGNLVGDASNTGLLQSGTICFTPIAAGNQPTVFQRGGGGIAIPKPVCRDVINGVIQSTYLSQSLGPLTVASSDHTSALGVQYLMTVTDNSDTSSYTLGIAYITGSSWSLDNWSPTNTQTLPYVGPSFIGGSLTASGPVTAPAFHGLADQAIKSQQWVTLPASCPAGYSPSSQDISGNFQQCNANSYQASGTTPGMIAQNPAGSEMVSLGSGYNFNVGSAASYSSFDSNGNLSFYAAAGTHKITNSGSTLQLDGWDFLSADNLQQAGHDGTQTQSILGHTWTSAAFFGDSITWGTGSTKCNSLTAPPTPLVAGADCYVGLIAQAAGIAPANAINYGNPGTEAADALASMLNNINEDVGSQKLITLMIGVNNASSAIAQTPVASVQQGPYEQEIITAGTWASTPASYKQAAGSVTATNWSQDTTYAMMTGLQSTTNGATFNSPSFTALESNGEYGFWYSMYNSNGGTFTAQTYDETTGANLAAPINITTTQLPAAVQSTTGLTKTVYTALFPNNLLTQGHVYHIIFTVTSATSASNIVSILGTFQGHSWFTDDLTDASPQLWISNITYKGGGAWTGGITQFNSSLVAAVNTLQVGWFPVNYVDNHPYLTGLVSQYLGIGNPHPNPTGHALLAKAFLANTVWAPLTALPTASASNTTINGVPCALNGSCTVDPTAWPSVTAESASWTTSCSVAWYGAVASSNITATLVSGCSAGKSVVISNNNNVGAAGTVSVTPVTNVSGAGETAVLLNGCSGQFLWNGSAWIQISTSCNGGKKGTAALSSGTVTISTARAESPSANTVYQISYCGDAGTPGILTLGTVTSNTSFVVNSITPGSATVNTADNSTICWEIN